MTLTLTYLLFRDQNGLVCGPRILTFFLYLSDVEEGGETSFSLLGHEGVWFLLHSFFLNMNEYLNSEAPQRQGTVMAQCDE